MRVAVPIPPVPNTQGLQSQTFKIPPLDGSLSLPGILDWLLANDVKHPAFVYMNDDGVERELLWPTVVKRIHNLARWVQETMRHADCAPSGSGNKPVIGILAALGM